MKYLIIILLLTSCVTQKKVSKFLDKHPDIAAEECAERFPVRDSVIVRDSVRFDTVIVVPDPVHIRDSFWIKGDTVVKQVTKQCPPHQVVTKTVTKDSIIIRRDRAFETVQQNQLNTAREQLQKSEQKVSDLERTVNFRTKRMWLFLWIAVGLAVWNFRKQIISLLARLIVPVKIPPV